jgi:hypothetical protein
VLRRAAGLWKKLSLRIAKVTSPRTRSRRRSSSFAGELAWPISFTKETGSMTIVVRGSSCSPRRTAQRPSRIATS